MTPIIVPLIAALSGAIAGGTAGWLLEWWRRRRDSRTLLNALFAELQHMRVHYEHSARGLSRSVAKPLSLRTALMWSRFDEVRTARDFQRYGFLDAPHIQLLLQIAFKVRNTDTFISLLLENPDEITSDQLEQLQSRMRGICVHSETLSNFIQKGRPQLRQYSGD
jgi:hypothetical protein